MYGTNIQVPCNAANFCSSLSRRPLLHGVRQLIGYIANATFTCTPSMSSTSSTKLGSYPLLNIGCMMEPATSECSSPSTCPNSCTATRNRFRPVNMQQAPCQANYIISHYISLNTLQEWPAVSKSMAPWYSNDQHYETISPYINGTSTQPTTASFLLSHYRNLHS